MIIRPLVHPGHALRHQEFIQSLSRIEPAPATVLHTAMWKHRLIVDGHAVDMHRARNQSQQKSYAHNSKTVIKLTQTESAWPAKNPSANLP